MNARLYAFDASTHSWKERGRGDIRLNDACQSEGVFQSRLGREHVTHCNYWHNAKHFVIHCNSVCRAHVYMSVQSHLHVFMRLKHLRMSSIGHKHNGPGCTYIHVYD